MPRGHSCPEDIHTQRAQVVVRDEDCRRARDRGREIQRCRMEVILRPGVDVCTSDSSLYIISDYLQLDSIQALFIHERK